MLCLEVVANYRAECAADSGNRTVEEDGSRVMPVFESDTARVGESAWIGVMIAVDVVIISLKQ
jgi:hypothetical protein